MEPCGPMETGAPDGRRRKKLPLMYIRNGVQKSHPSPQSPCLFFFHRRFTFILFLPSLKQVEASSTPTCGQPILAFVARDSTGLSPPHRWLVSLSSATTKALCPVSCRATSSSSNFLFSTKTSLEPIRTAFPSCRVLSTLAMSSAASSVPYLHSVSDNELAVPHCWSREVF